MLTHLMHKSACQMDGGHVCRMQSQEIPLTSSIYCISESSVAPASKEKSKKEVKSAKPGLLIPTHSGAELHTGERVRHFASNRAHGRHERRVLELQNLRPKKGDPRFPTELLANRLLNKPNYHFLWCNLRFQRAHSSSYILHLKSGKVCGICL